MNLSSLFTFARVYRRLFGCNVQLNRPVDIPDIHCPAHNIAGILDRCDAGLLSVTTRFQAKLRLTPASAFTLVPGPLPTILPAWSCLFSMTLRVHSRPVISD
jgi:hypothetical protein